MIAPVPVHCFSIPFFRERIFENAVEFNKNMLLFFSIDLLMVMYEVVVAAALKLFHFENVSFNKMS